MLEPLLIPFIIKLHSMAWGSIYKRRMKVFSMALLVYLDYKALKQREKWIGSSERASLWERAHERNANRIVKLMIDLEGLWVKMGQYLSVRAEGLPSAYPHILKQLQDSLPPRRLEEVRRTIQKELGKSMDDLFTNFVEEPLATASIAQVHRATLCDGQEVVVKVQHEGIKTIILEDLKDAKSIVEWIVWAEPKFDFNPVIDEWCKEAPKELDFNQEAENTRKVSSNLGCKSERPDRKCEFRVKVLIPEVIQSTEKVLILEYMDGVRLNDSSSLEALGVNKIKLVEEITRAYAHQIFVDGFFNADPHPGNFLVTKKHPHYPVLLDFGFTKSLSSSLKHSVAKMFLSSAELDAFSGDIILFLRVLNLLAGLSSSLNVSVSYYRILRPFAESALECGIDEGPVNSAEWVHNSPVHSDVEAELRPLLVELKNADKILGIQVCAYKDGKVIIDTAAGVLGSYDPSPVQPDTLFPVFSVTKGVTSGMMHWLVDKGKLKLEENVANIWQEFGSNKKDEVKVNHILNHTSGLHNALANLVQENPMLLCNWEECLKRIATVAPETEPGSEQLYHYLSYGWLCGGIIEHASKKKFQDVLEEAFIHPLNIEGELYIGIPPGVEFRLATLTLDTSDLSKSSGLSSSGPSSLMFQLDMLAGIIPLFNTLNLRRAILPAANGHCSARALARYYAALVDGGVVPPSHSSSSLPPLGSHPHLPPCPMKETPDKQKGGKKKDSRTDPKSSNSSHEIDKLRVGKIFSSSKKEIHDAFLGSGDYEKLIIPNGRFGLGFKRVCFKDGSIIGFGHAGLGGSTAYCDINNRFAIVVTLNKLSFGGVTGEIIRFVCSKLNIPVPEDYATSGEKVIN